jgi:hypothetical protein
MAPSCRTNIHMNGLSNRVHGPEADTGARARPMPELAVSSSSAWLPECAPNQLLKTGPAQTVEGWLDIQVDRVAGVIVSAHHRSAPCQPRRFARTASPIPLR